MANKNLDVTLQVKLAGVQDAERKLKDLQKELTRINATYFSKKAFFKDIDVKVNVNLGNVKQTQQQLQQAFQNTTVNVPTQTVGETANTSTPQSGQNFDWKTAIQFTKMKALTPAALMQTASRITSLSTAFSGLIGVLTAVSVRTAFSTFTKYTRNVSGALGELKGVVLSLTGMDKMFSVSGITNSMIALADVTKEIQKQSLQTGIAVDALSQYRFAMKQVGVSAENFGSNISYMGKAIVQAATGVSVDAGNAFKKLKLDPKTLRLKDTQTQFEEIAKAIAQLPSETDKASAALLIFNRSGSQLLPFINKFSEGLKQSEGVLGQLPRLMKLYSSEFTQFSNNISNLKVKGQQFIGGFMTQMVPSLNSYLQEFLKVDFTDFGKMFADNFQRTIASLNTKDDVGGLLNSFILDLMDVVDKALQKTIDYVGEALIKIDWSAITEGILKGTWHFVIKSAQKAGEVIVESGTPNNANAARKEAEGQIGELLLELKKQGIKSTEEQVKILEEIYDAAGIKKGNTYSLEQYYGKNYREHFKNSEQIPWIESNARGYRVPVYLTEQESKLLASEISKRLENKNTIEKLFTEYAATAGEEQAKAFRNNFLNKVIEDRTESYLNSIQSEIEKDVKAYKSEQLNNRRGFRAGVTPVEVENYRNSLIQQRTEEFRNTEYENISRELTSNIELQQLFLTELRTRIEKESNTAAQATADAQNKLTKAITSLERRIKDTDFVSKVEADKHNEILKDNTVSEEDKNKEQERYIKVQTTIAKERLQAYLDTNKVLNATKELLQSDEEWIKKHKEVNDAIKETTLLISKLASENEIAVQETLLKQFALDAERAERDIKSLKNSLNALKSDKSLTADNIKAIGGGYKSYIDSLYSKRDVLESKQTAYISSGFNKDLIDKTAREIEDLNNTIQQAINERNDWTQSVILESTKNTVTQRNTDLGQFEFKQMPQWAATDKQKYDYQIQVYDAQIKASKDNIESIRKAQQAMLDIDPAVQKVKESMEALDKSASDYDQKYARLLNDLDEARRNSGVKKTAAFLNLEQMRGEEETKNKMAKSRKIQQEDPTSMAHQMSKSINDASNQMGELTQNIAQGFGNIIMSVRDSLSTLIADLLNGTLTIGQAFQKMGQTILQALINTFAQIVANFIMQQTVMRLFQAMTNASLAAEAAALTAIWKTPATLASIASWGAAAGIGKSAVEAATAIGTTAMAKGGRIKGKEQIIRVNEEGEEFVVSARSPMSNEKYLELANMGYNLDSLFANQSMKEVNASASKLNIINNNKTERPQTNNNINIGMINSRQDKRRWMRKEGQRMIVDFLNGHRGALKYA